MFVPCIIRRSRNNQYTPICTIPLFDILTPTCFGSNLPSSGIFLDPSVVVPRNHGNPAHRSRNHTYDIPPIRFVFQVTQKDQRSSLMIAGYCRNMQEPVYRVKEWYNSVHICWSFPLHFNNSAYFLSSSLILVSYGVKFLLFRMC
jgi:hypothetical protein